MKNTCDEECPMWKAHGEHCPNYMVNYYRENDSSQELRVKDCAPKRLLLMLFDLNNLLLGLQKTSNEERNVNDRLTYAMFEAVKFANENPGKLEVNFPDGSTDKIQLPAGSQKD